MTPGVKSLLLLHGFAQTPASWQTTIAELPTGLTIAAPELPGHGRTGLSLGQPSPELARAVAAEALEATGGPATVWGYSQGARVAFDLALERPELVQALIIESGAPGIADAVQRAQRRRNDEDVAQRIESVSMEDFVRGWELLPALGDPPRDVIEQQRPDRLRNEPAALAAALRGMGQGAYPSMWERLSEITIPVLLITGARDITYERHAEAMLRVLPDARHHVIDDAGHSVHIEQPVAAAALVAQFLTEIS